jgi:hypothetical protein
MNEELSILEKPIQTIATSKEFQEMCSLNGFKNLNGILEYQINYLLTIPGFNHRILKELYQILEVHKLTGKIKES